MKINFWIMEKDLIATVRITVNKNVETVWRALVTPAIIKEYMFGTDVTSDFKEGSEIRWSGEWQGKRYEDKGKILSVKKNHILKYSHFSPLAGQPDIPENYHTVKISLAEKGEMTEVVLEQDNNKTEDAKLHSEKNWRQMLQSLKAVLEGSK